VAQDLDSHFLHQKKMVSLLEELTKEIASKHSELAVKKDGFRQN